MSKPPHVKARIIPALLLLLVAAGSAAGAEPALPETGSEPEPQVIAESTPLHPEDERHVETLEQKGGKIGYNFVGVEGYGGRASEYGYLHSSPAGSLYYKRLEKDSNLDLDGSFLNGHDYHGDLLFDFGGDYRMHLRTESLFHNLDREFLFFPNFQAARTDARTPADYIAVQDPPVDYGASIVQDNADFRYRLHNYPLHVNLGYWRYTREGTIQQRFADTAFEGTPNTIYALPRTIDHVTQEGRVGLDAHLGPVDLIYDFKVRVFEDREPIPVANYVTRNDLDGTPANTGGVQQHDEYPDSRLFSHTVKAHSSLAGGLVAGGSYSIQELENHSRLSDTVWGKSITANYQNAAGDFVYTPLKEFSLAVKYRRQELDHEHPSFVVSQNLVDPVQIPKPPVNSVKDLVTATLTYKPRRDLSVTGEYRGEFIKRDHVSSLPTTLTWDLPESTDIHTGSLSAHYRPVTGVRVDANYNYTVTDHPAYGSSFEQKHEGKLLATYTRSNRWGGTADLVVRREWNDHVGHFLIELPLDPLVLAPSPAVSRKRTTENANVAAWVVPFARLTVGANYAYVQTKVDQPVLFTGVFTGSEAASNFVNRSHVYGVNATYSVKENLDLSLMLQQVRLISCFDPQLVAFSATSSTFGIRDITREHTVISSLSARGEYRFTPAISSSLEYTLRDYNEKNPAYSAYNGTVHAVLATLAAKW